jgi:hypothetical protein
VTHARCIEGSIELPGLDDRHQPVERPEAVLLCAVLRLAWVDACDRADYRQLAGTTSRGWWSSRCTALQAICDALGLDLSWVVARARRRLAEYDAGDVDTRRRIRGQADYADRQEEEWERAEPPPPDRDKRASIQRAYYVRHRDSILVQRGRRYEAEQKARRMEARFPGYASRHPGNVAPSQAPDETTENP